MKMSKKTYTRCEIDEMVEVIEALGYEVIKRGYYTQFDVSYHEDTE